MVPGALGDFDEANSGFDHASGNEAFATEALGFLAVESVKLFGLFALGLDIENLGEFRLHSVSHLVGADNSFDFLIPWVVLKFLLIHALDEIQLAALPFAADQGSEVRNLGFIDFTISISQSHALVVSWQEGVSIILGAAGCTDADKTRDALVLGPEAIEDPRTDTRTYKLARASVHSDCGLGVGRHLGLHRIDDEHVIGNFSQFREQIGDPQAALASLLKFPGRLHPFASAPGPVLPIGLGQFRLVVESIDVGRTTSHVEEDDPLGLGREMRSRNSCCSIGEPLFGQKCRKG